MSTRPDFLEKTHPLRQHRRYRYLLHQRRKHQFLRAALVGLLAGTLAVLFQQALWHAEQLRGYLLHYLQHYPAWGWSVLPLLCAFLGGIAAWMTARFAPEASGSGIPHVKGVLLSVRTLQWKKLLPVKFIGGVLAIGAGFSLGREGPSVQMGAAAGKIVSDLLQVPRRERRHLLACGAGAGLAAAFNAPLAGFFFVIEELQRELSLTTYGTALIAAVIADILTRAFTGQLPSFHISGYPTPPLATVPLFAVLGAAAGLLGVVFNQGLLRSLRRFQQCTRIPGWGRAALVGTIVGLTLWRMPLAVGGGHSTAEAILRGDFNGSSVLHILLPLLAVKLVLTLISYAAGVPGGIFAPLLVLGALLGLMVGQASALLLPHVTQTPAAFAVVGMAATFTAIVHAPVTGIVLILEMTGNHEQLLPLLVACLIAFLVSEQLQNHPIYDSLLEADLVKKGLRRRDEPEALLLDLVVEPESPIAGRLVRAAGFPKGCLLITVRRGGQEIIPQGDTRLEAGDHLSVLVSGASPDGCAAVSALARAPH